MGKVIMSGIVPQLEKPVTGILLSDFAEGSIVKLNESGSPVEFYVAKHDYESGLNGAGRTLLVRKDVHSKRQWDNDNSNVFAGSDIDIWLNGSYKNMLDSVARTAIETTTFYHSAGNKNTTLTTLARSVFLLSVCELAVTSTSAFVAGEGSALPIESILQIAYLNGQQTAFWTRSPNKNYSNEVWCLYDIHTVSSNGPIYENGIRPCFTLPSTAIFDEETLLFKEIS